MLLYTPHIINPVYENTVRKMEKVLHKIHFIHPSIHAFRSRMAEIAYSTFNIGSSDAVELEENKNLLGCHVV